MNQTELRGKVAIVTGAAAPRGLGRVMTQELVKAGARVSMVDINECWLDDAAAHMRSIGGPDCVMTQLVDVTSYDEVERSIENTIKTLGGLHVLVNNAGIAPKNMFLGVDTGSRAWELSPEEFARGIAVNTSGSFHMLKGAIPVMLAQNWGRVIGVTTSFGTMCRAGGAPYGPSKAAHEALIAMVSSELEGTGVTANVLVPGGLTSTNMVPDDATFERETMIQPDVMGAPVVWLASEESNNFNGQRIVAYHWDEDLPQEERLAKASAPAAWPQLEGQPVFVNK